MSKTPYNSLDSEDILAGHLSGIQQDINKIQNVLDMKTGTKSGHSLEPVADQDDLALRYRIYEATERNWLDSPVPSIYRNGLLVVTSEYILQAPYGTIVFHEQQNSNDNVTADFTHINNVSKIITDMNNTINTNSSNITQLIKPNNYAYLHVAGYYRTNNIINANIETSAPLDTNIMELSMFVVAETTTYDDMAIRCSYASAGSYARFGLYDDNGSLYPNNLLADGGQVEANVVGVKNFLVSLTLEPGIYWFATITSDNMAGWSFVEPSTLPQFGMDGSLVGSTAYGYEVSHDTATPLESIFPSGAGKRFIGSTRHPSIFLRKV